MSRRHRGDRRKIAHSRSQKQAHSARPEMLEGRLLLSAAPAVNITSMIDHSGGFAGAGLTDMRFNGGTAGLPAVTNVTDSTGNVLYSNVLQLTNGKVGETSSAFSDPPPDGTADVLGIDTFDTTFDFTYGPTVPPAGDGFTFTIQNSPAKALALGNGGGSLGYKTITNSIAIKFDLYKGGTSPNASTTGLYLNGEQPGDTNVRAVNSTTVAPSGASVDLTQNPNGTATGIDFHANPSDDYRVHLVYDGTTLTETLTDVTKNITVSQPYTVNVPAAVNGHTAYAGFTGATGGAFSEQDIISWKFTGVQTGTGLVPLPTPNLFATPCTSGVTLITWSNVGGNELGVEIDRSSDGTNFSPVTTVSPGTTHYMDSGLDPTKTFTYKIKALGDNSTTTDSAFSNPASASAAGLNPPVAINHAGGFAGATDLMLNGVARILGPSATPPNALQLTTGTADAEVGTAFDTNAQLVNQFDTSFDFTFGSTIPPMADGFTFTLQAGPPDSRGGLGGGLGYVTIPNSMAVKFDLYDAGLGPVASTTGVYFNGAAPDDNNEVPVNSTLPTFDGQSVDLTTDQNGNKTGIDFHANPTDRYRVHLTYDGSTLTETVSDVTKNITVTQQYTIDIPGTIASPCAFVGFTGADAGARSEQDILKWTFVSGGAHLRLVADFNNDGSINFSDLLILAQNYGKSPRTFAQGDANGDGTVNFADLLLLAQNYGQTSSATSDSLVEKLLRPQKTRRAVK